MTGSRFDRGWLAVGQWGAHVLRRYGTRTVLVLCWVSCCRDRIIEISLSDKYYLMTPTITLCQLPTDWNNCYQQHDHWQPISDVLYFIQGLYLDLGHIICQTFTEFMVYGNIWIFKVCIFSCQDYSYKWAASLVRLSWPFGRVLPLLSSLSALCP